MRRGAVVEAALKLLLKLGTALISRRFGSVCIRASKGFGLGLAQGCALGFSCLKVTFSSVMAVTVALTWDRSGLGLGLGLQLRRAGSGAESCHQVQRERGARNSHSSPSHSSKASLTRSSNASPNSYDLQESPIRGTRLATWLGSGLGLDPGLDTGLDRGLGFLLGGEDIAISRTRTLTLGLGSGSGLGLGTGFGSH